MRINPNGHIPSLDDDGFILWESLAINFYLAEKYGTAPLSPGPVQDRGRAPSQLLVSPALSMVVILPSVSTI